MNIYVLYLGPSLRINAREILYTRALVSWNKPTHIIFFVCVGNYFTCTASSGICRSQKDCE